MSALISPGCLITQPVQFEAPATFPPSIESSEFAVHPLDMIVVIPLDDGTMLPADFEVEVRDPDVDEALEYQVYVDFVANAIPPRAANEVGDIPSIDRSAGTDRTRRRLMFDIAGGDGLAIPGCHRVELIVSSGFRNQSREPVIEGDVGTAVWWVASQMTDTSEVNMVNCQ